MKKTWNKIHRRSDQPWFGRWKAARQRCNNPNDQRYQRYGGRGIKMDLPFWAMGVLYWRDKAHEMKRASIDRKDNDGNYTYDNCKFIESSEHSKKTATGNTNRLGKKTPKETCKKISESIKKHWELRKNGNDSTGVEQESG